MFISINKKINNLSLYEAFAPMYYISKVLGLSPFSFVNQREEKVQLPKVQFSFFWFLFSIFWVITWCYLYVIAVQSIVFVPFAKGYPMISIMGHLIHIYACVIVFIASFGTAPFKANKLTIIAQQLQNFDDDLSQIHKKKNINYKLTFQFQLISIILGLVLFLLAELFDCWIFFDLYGSIVWMICFCYAYPYTISLVIHFQLVTIIFSIYQRFKAINSFLYHIAKVNEPTSVAVKTYLAEKDQLKAENNDAKKVLDPVVEDITFSDEKQIDETNYFKIPIKTNEEKFNAELFTQNKKMAFLKEMKKDIDQDLPKNLHLQLNELFILHDKLCDLSEIVNDSFGLETVICIAVSFVVIIFGFFFETKVLFFPWGSNPKLVFIATSYVIWGLLANLAIYCMLTTCTVARETANEAALIVHKILQNKPAFMLNDEIFYNKMKSFTLQILHRKNTFFFNGLGLFRLDYTFIFSAVSAATSYLIVLLQFDLSSNLADFYSRAFNIE